MTHLLIAIDGYTFGVLIYVICHMIRRRLAQRRYRTPMHSD
jgi:hypothetical protein